MKSYRVWAMASVSAAVLSACTTLDTQHPDQMYRQAVMNNLQKDNQYNFSGEATLSWQNKDGVSNNAPVLKAADVIGEADQAAAAAAEALQVADAAAMELDVDDDDTIQTNQTQETWDEIATMVIEGAAQYPVVSSFMKHSAFKAEGAMDLKAGQFEINPSMKLGTANYSGWAQLPMHFDGKNERILVDAQGYASAMQNSIYGSESSPSQLALIERLENGALLELSAPKDSEMRYPIQTVFKAIPKALDGYLNAMDAKHFELIPMDDYGKSLGAAHRIKLEYGNIESMRWYGAFLKSYNDEFERLQKEAPEAGVSDEAYEAIKSTLMLGAMLTGEVLPDEATCKESPEAAADCLVKEQELEQKMAGLPNLQHNLYLNRSGRIVGVHDAMVLKHPRTEQALVYSSKMKFYNYGRPQFTMNVKNRPTVSIWDVIQTRSEVKDWEDSNMVDAAAAADAAAEAAAQAAQ